MSWREGEEIALVIVSRLRNLARRLVVPGAHYGAARRLLREKIAAHDIQLIHTGLELGAHDESDDVNVDRGQGRQGGTGMAQFYR